jgi:hypothetical protein
MSDLEQRLTDVLAEEAHAAPSAVGLATAARSRARQRRRTRLVGAVAVAAVVVGVPTAVAVIRDDDGSRDSNGRVADDLRPDTGAPKGFRYESWHGVTIEVPDSWGYGSLQDWCGNGGDVGTPQVERWGAPRNDILCQPTSTYGVSFAPAEKDIEWPVADQHSDSWPNGAYVGATTVGGVVVTVAAPDAGVAAAVLASARPIGPQGDPNRCPSSRGEARPDVPDNAMAVCRYDDQGLLEQSELLTGDAVAAALRALEEAPPDTGDCAVASDEMFPVIRLRTADLHANVDLGGGCPGIRGLENGDRVLTADVLYWALSPGWSGAVDGDIPLPKELRQR